MEGKRFGAVSSRFLALRTDLSSRAPLPQDPNKPKRALSAFFLYSQAERPKVKEANPELSFGDCVRRIIALAVSSKIVRGPEGSDENDPERGCQRWCLALF